MSLKKLVDGELVDMDEQEEAAVLAEWEANADAPQAMPAPTPVAKLQAFLEANPDVAALLQ